MVQSRKMMGINEGKRYGKLCERLGLRLRELEKSVESRKMLRMKEEKRREENTKPKIQKSARKSTAYRAS